ncbi:MarR family winged helix-turn-helix transcriptional regulator [Streptomyces sp. PT12]|uniref:MarR family winged helix-turn-helix transcriptional regulator n=1 Tax=Streptomyces sp. PT12 TaxID=1510197 RepID=UPI000DE300E5|nr:MarR family transcriptional regulator [Streptomyces sp. PT12]RBM21451.1 MarR family transcriptional regulator [Streptomyces sp. PT12]
MEHTEETCARAFTALADAHARVSEALGAALAASCGLTVNDFEVLVRLSAAPPPGLRLKDLAPAVRLTQPSLSRLVARLESGGLVARSGAPDDRRGVLITLTPAGRAALEEAVPIQTRIVRELLLDRLTPEEQDLLARALTRIGERR